MATTFPTVPSEEWITVVRPKISKDKIIELTFEDLSPLLLSLGIDASVVQLLADLKINGKRLLQKGFVSATFTPQVMKGKCVNPQKLIELRNSVLSSAETGNSIAVIATAQTQISSLTATIQGLPVFANDTLATALPILERLSDGDSYVSSVFKFVHSAAFAINNIWYDGAKQRCLDLLQTVQLTIQASPDFILSPPQRFNAVFAELRAVIKEVVMLVATFVPPTEDVPFKQNAQYWIALVTAKHDEFVRLKEKLKDVNQIIVTQIVIALAQHTFTSADHNRKLVEEIPTENLNVDNFTKDLLVEVRKWYDSQFKFELGAKGDVDLKELYIELKVLQTSNEEKRTKDQVAIQNSGKIADTSSLHQHLWTGCLSNIVLVEGPAGIGKTSFCMKLCCLQNIEGAVVIFVPLKQLLGRGRIDSIANLLSIINSPVRVINALPNILHYQIPIVWILDGFDEVMRTDDYSVQFFLNNFVDPTTRKKHLDNNDLPDLVRTFDFVILTSRENRVDTNIVAIDSVRDPKLKPDLWIVQRWKRNNIEDYVKNFFDKLNKTISDADVKLLVDHSLGRQMSGFHGIPLFIKLLCQAKLEDDNLDLTNISPPFLYQKTLRNAFVRSKISIEAVLDLNPQFIRYKADLNGLYDKILDDASCHAFQEFLAHRGTALTFSVPCDEKLPPWILVMREMGVLLNDSNETKFKFQHRSFIEYLAAQFVALNPVEALPLVPFLDELDTTWLLICQLACLRENDGFFKKLLEKGLTTTFLANHVAELSLKEYNLLGDAKLNTRDREEIITLSENHQIKLLVQIANSLPKNLFMDSLLGKHGFLARVSTPSQFKWMTEWCGYYGAIDVLKWFASKVFHASSVLSKQNCRYALCQALQRQSVSNVKTTIDFLVDKAGELSMDDAIATESTVALQMALKKKKTFADTELIEIVAKMVDRTESNPNLVVAMCLFAEFNADQLSKLELFNPSPVFFVTAVSFQVTLPEFSEIWNFCMKSLEKITVATEMKNKAIGKILLPSQTQAAPINNWNQQITEIFVKECIPKFGKKMAKMKYFVRHLDLSHVRKIVTDATVDFVCNSFSLVRSLNLSNCEFISQKSLQSLAKLESLETLDLSKCTGIADIAELHSLLQVLSNRHVLKTVKLEDIPKINSAYRFVAAQLIADPSLSTLDLSGSSEATDEVLTLLLAFGNPITSVNLHLCPKFTNGVLGILASARGIVHLDLSKCLGIDDLAALHSFLLARRHVLKTVNLEGLPKINSAYCAIAPLLIANSSLPALDFSDSPEVTDQILGMIVEFGNPLNSVNLSNCNLITDAGIEHIAKLSRITKLNVEGCFRITDAALERISKLSDIVSLVLSGCYRITDSGIECLSSLAGITSLNLSRCVAISDAGLELICRLKSITNLDVSRCCAIGDGGLRQIANLAGITSLDVAGCNMITDGGLQCISNCTRITSLNVSNCEAVTDVGLQHVSKLSSIASLDLSGCHKITDAGVTLIPSSFAGITSLDLAGLSAMTNVGLQNIGKCSKITSLSIGNCKGLADADLENVAKLSGITSLNLTGFKSLVDDDLLQISKLSGITSINLSGCFAITDGGLQHIAKKITGIKSLELASCIAVTDIGLAHVSTLSSISVLNLMGCFAITDAGLRQVAKLSALEILNISGCNRITGAGLEQISKLAKINTLDLFGCDKICDGDLQHVAKLVNITSLNLSWCNKISDLGLPHVAKLSRITSLNLARCDKIHLSDACMRSQVCARMGRIAFLNLSNCKEVSDSSLLFVSTLATITSLDLSGCDKITDGGGLQQISKLSGITSLNLARCSAISDIGMQHVAKMVSVLSLNLSNCGLITDVGLRHVSALEYVAFLNLSRCLAITDSGLDHVADLSKILTLDLTGCKQISAEGKKKFHSILPNCRLSE